MKQILTIIQLVFMIFIISCNNKLLKIANDIYKIETIGISEENLSDTEFDWRID